MLKLTKTGIGLLTRQYRSVLHKCWLINMGLFGLIATATITSPTSADEIDKIYIDSGTIDTVEGSFSNRTTVTGNYGQGIEMWGGQINYINVDAKNNNFTASFTLEGGYLLQERGEIGTITGNYINNTVRSTESFASSAALFSSAKLNSIANAIFKNNQVISSTFGYGGALLFYSDYNTNRTADIGKITADFDSNKVIASGNELAYGGAISLLNAPQMTSTIDEISGIFSNNGVETNSGSAWGGAISNNIYQDAASQTTNIIHNIYDSTFTGNYAKSESGSASGGAIYNTGTIGISAKNTDTVFRDNKTIVGSSTSYNDIDNSGTLHLNAASGKTIDFGGSITGTGTLNINNGYNSSSTGGDYIFRNEVSGQTMNLYDGANVQLRNLRQADGTTSYGKVYLTGMTVTGAGNILDTRNGILEATAGAPITQQSAAPYLGNLTLNNDLIWRLDVDLSQSGIGNDSDYLNYSSVSGSGKIVIDAINLATNSGTQTQAFVMRSTAPVKTQTGGELAAGYHTFTPDYKDKYTVKWSTDGARGLLNFTDNGTMNLNLVGFLSVDTANTEYYMTSDEPVLRNIGVMTGTTKTVNAGNYTINGNGFRHVETAGSDKVLTVNGGTWQNFTGDWGGVFDNTGKGTMIINNAKIIDTHSNSGGAIYNQEYGAKLTVKNSVFMNNSSSIVAGAINNSHDGAVLTVENSDFVMNTSVNAGAIRNEGKSSATITARGSSMDEEIGRVTFSFNTASQNGGAIINNGEMTISATGGDVLFKNNTAGTQGGAIYNSGTLDISASNDHKVVFEGNNENGAFTSGTGGGAIANTGTLSIKNAIFKNNTTSGWNAGGAAISSSAGSISEIVAEFTNNSALGSGGAIWNYTNIDNIDGFFKGNNAYYYGGAIYNQYVSIGTIIGDFIENYVDNSKDNSFEAHGGAIDNYNKNSSVSSISANFTGNYAKSPSSAARGGAISNAGPIGEITDSNFTNNYTETSGASALGGAIYNDNIISNIQNSTFSGNYVSGNDDSKGGAIYNEGSIGFSGTNTFTNNKANEVPNDIYNAGTININGGTTTLNSGYIGSETSALTVKSGGTLTANAALEVADGGTLTNESGGTLAVSADNLKIDETTNNGTLELEGGNVTTKLMGTGRMKLMSGNVRLLSSTPPATTGSLSFGSSSDYADSILTSSSAASTSDHALVTAGYLDNNYYMNYGDSMAKSFIKAANDNHKNVIVRSAKHDVTIFGRQSDNTATTSKQAA